MQDVHTRKMGLHHLLTGGTGDRTSRCAYPPRHLWGDLGLPEAMPGRPRRSFPARLLQW